MGYPAHPVIQKMRTDVCNRTCFTYPQIVKNEIEYLHAKINQFPEDPSDELMLSTRYEKEFRTGSVSSDYQKLL